MLHCVKLWNIEDTTLFEEIEQVRNASKEILGYSFDEEYCNTIMDLDDAQVQPTLNTIYSCSVSACNQNGSFTWVTVHKFTVPWAVK